jgi:hypothetical protein
MSRLVKQIDGKAGQGVKGAKYPPGRETNLGIKSFARGGIVIDDLVTPLQGEPPIAVTHGWGRVPGF